MVSRQQEFIQKAGVWSQIYVSSNQEKIMQNQQIIEQ